MPENSLNPILIKRYANRKLYNTEESKYINLSDIHDMVRADVPVQIIDNKTGEDVTRRMLAQMMVESEKKQTRRSPYDLLQKVIGSSAEPVNEVVSKLHIDQGKEIVDSLRVDLEDEVQKWLRKGEVTRDEIKHYFDNWQKNIDNVASTTENTVSGWLDKVMSRVQSNELINRINELEKRIQALENKR